MLYFFSVAASYFCHPSVILHNSIFINIYHAPFILQQLTGLAKKNSKFPDNLGPVQ